MPSGPIYSIDQVFADPQVKHLGIVETLPRETGKDLKVVGQPVTLSRTPSKAQRVPPDRGEHNAEVLQEFGFSAAEIAELQRSGAL